MLAVKDRPVRPKMGELRVISNHRSNLESTSIWGKVSTYTIIAVLVFFAMNGLSPFVNQNMYLRFGNTTPEDSVVARIVAWAAYLVCAWGVYRHQKSIVRRLFRLKALALLPFLAIASSFWSQLPMASLRQGVLLLGATLFAVFFTHNFTPRLQMQLLMVCGAITAVGTVLFAVLLPQYGLDHMGGHEHAWKGIFTAKNVCGQTMLLLLTPAFYHRARALTARILQGAYILLLIGVILMSQAATSWIFLAAFLVGQLGARIVARFALKDMVLVTAAIAAIVLVGSLEAYHNSSYLLALLGKDPTFTGRTDLWTAAIISIAKNPFLGYGFAAFWNGLHGESATLLISVRNFLSQPQNGFLDIWLQLGLGGIVLFLCSVVAFARDFLCLLHARRMTFVHWYATIVVLTLLFNAVESYLLFPRYLGWLLYLVACYGINDRANQARQMNGSRIPA